MMDGLSADFSSPKLHLLTGASSRHPLAPRSAEVVRNRYHSTSGDTSYIFFAPGYDRLTESERRRLFRDEFLDAVSPGSPAGSLSTRRLRAVPFEVAREAIDDCRLATFIAQGEQVRKKMLLREKGWDDRTPVAENFIPAYDSLSDRHLPNNWRKKAVKTMIHAETAWNGNRQATSDKKYHSSQFIPTSYQVESQGYAARTNDNNSPRPKLKVRNGQRPFLAEYGPSVAHSDKRPVNRKFFQLEDHIVGPEPIEYRLKSYPTRADRSWTTKVSPKHKQHDAR